MEENSGVKFQEAMVALGRQWVGNDNDNEGTWQPDSVSMVLPADNSNVGVGVEGATSERKTETYPLPKTVNEARQIIERFEHGSDELRSDDNVADNVVQHMLRDSTSLLDEKWAGTPEEERSAFVSELLYIHSKLMIVDDRRVIVSPAVAFDPSSPETASCRWGPRISTIVVRRRVIPDTNIERS